MAQSGKSTVLRLDEAVAALTDISAKLTNVDFPETIDALPSHTFGDNSKEFVTGLKSATISLSGHWDATIETHLSGIRGHATSKTFEYGPVGSTAGLTKITGECILTAYRRTDPVEGTIGFTAELQVTGDVTVTTW